MKQPVTSAIGVAALLVASALATHAWGQAGELRASYWKLVDGNDYFASGEHLVFEVARLSADGTTVIAEGRNSWTGERVMFFVDTFSGSMTEVSYPTGVSSAWDDSVAISADGSRVFFADSVNDSLYRVDRHHPGTPAVTKILDRNDYQGNNPANINGIYQVRALATGDAVYFSEDRDGLWRVDAMTGAATLVVNDAAVPRDGGTGWAVSWFDVSDDESVIAFTLLGYSDGSTHEKHELFVRSDGSFSQLTNESLPVFPYYVPKTYVELDSSGSVITYDDLGNAAWTSIGVDGSNKIQLRPSSNNVAGSSMTSNGQLLLLSDAGSAGGHLARTDGGGGVDLMPVYPTGLWATAHPEISADGSIVSFVSGGDRRKLYAGSLSPLTWVGPGPTIDTMTLDPAWLLDSDPGSGVVLTASISDPQGAAQVVETSISHYVEGLLEGSWDNLPVLFSSSPNDDGVAPDQVAGDYIYSAFGALAGGFPNVPVVNIRIGAQDVDGNITVREVMLSTCPAPACVVFDDGFESGGLNAWTASVSGRSSSS